jgi:hypothetical protein
MRLSLRAALTAGFLFLLFSPSYSFAAPHRVIVFVNGWLDCCA